ncbi:MAG: hypothetical protein J5986_11950, partial [Roseburia sp.]|nr:hypothetical protein [Roseburia sp.]
THGLLSQLGYLLGRGTICSLLAVLFVLPGFLYLADPLFMKDKNKKKKKNAEKGGIVYEME